MKRAGYSEDISRNNQPKGGEMMFEEVSRLKISLARRGMTAKIEP
jgi:hypothetical protein